MLRNTARENRFKPLHLIVAKFTEDTGLKICINTACKYLHACGTKNYNAVCKPFLSTKNVTARKEWAAKDMHWAQDDWCKFAFSDESSFTVKPKKSRGRIWCESNRRYVTANNLPTFKSGYVVISVRAAFSGRVRTPLICIDGTLNK